MQLIRPQSLAILLCVLLVFVAAIQPNGRAQAPIALVATGSSLPEPLYFATGTKLDMPGGLPKVTEEGTETAPHSHPRAEPGKSCPKP